MGGFYIYGFWGRLIPICEETSVIFETGIAF